MLTGKGLNADLGKHFAAKWSLPHWWDTDRGIPGTTATRNQQKALPQRQMAIYFAIQNRNSKMLELLLDTFLQSFDFEDM